jgi:predicted dehydrogenase
MRKIRRRTLLEATVAAGLAGIGTSSSWAGVGSANDIIGVGIVGLRGKGRHHIEMFSAMEGARITALCDVDQEVLSRSLEKIKNQRPKPEAYADVRKLLDDKNVDAVVIAAPNHWHSLMTIWACQAGKDVYVEKPASHNLFEGRQMVKAARQYKRVVQTGMQNRSSLALQEALAYIRAGNLGRILRVRGLCYDERDSIGKTNGPQPIPAGIDYGLWTGPAPLEPLRRQRLHYDWHWFWNTGDGNIGNQGIHQLDLCRWFAGQDELPKSAISLGGRYGYVDDAQTPNTQVVLFDYPVPIIFEVRGLPESKGAPNMDHLHGVRVGFLVECENGTFAGGKSGGGWVYGTDQKRIKQFSAAGEETHANNFIDAVRSRSIKDLRADVREGYLSAGLFQMANLSHRLGTESALRPALDLLTPWPDFQETVERMRQHLAANEVDLQGEWLTSGARLDFDLKRGHFSSQSSYDIGYWANLLSEPQYRRPFVISEML